MRRFESLPVGSVFTFYRGKYVKTAKTEAVSVHKFLPRGGFAYRFNPKSRISVILKA